MIKIALYTFSTTESMLNTEQQKKYDHNIMGHVPLYEKMPHYMKKMSHYMKKTTFKILQC